jgi:transcriptional regulator with XRE-family HTH domain
MPKTKTSDVAVKMVGQALRRARRQMGITQAELAARLGVNASYITNVEAGRVNLTVGQLAALSEALNAALRVEIEPLPSEIAIGIPLLSASTSLD